MAALSAARSTRENCPPQLKLRLPVKADAVIYPGALVVLDAGYAKPGEADDNAATVVVVGRAKGLAGTAAVPPGGVADNTGGSDGDIHVEVEEGEFLWDNSAGDALAAADVGVACYIEDDHTVAATADNQAAAGIFLGFAEDGQCIVRSFIGCAANGATVP